MPGPRLTIVEDLGTRLPDADIVVALSPVAWLQCRNAGLAVTVIEDHIERRAILPETEAYIRWQLGWAARIDAALRSGYAARTAFWLLKIPTDAVVTRSVQLQALVEALAPREICYLGPPAGENNSPWHRGHLQFWRTLGDSPLSAELLPYICRNARVPFRQEVSASPAEVSEREGRLDLLRAKLGRFRDRRRAFRALRSPGRGAATLMLWSAGFGARHVARRELDAGRRLFVLEREDARIRVLEPTGRRLRHRSTVSGTRLPQRRQLPLDPTLVQLLEEVERWTRVPGSSAVLRSRFSTFIDDVIPTVACAAEDLAQCYRRLGVDRVVCVTGSTIQEHVALLAARNLGLERELLQHGEQLVLIDGFFPDIETFTDMGCSDPSMPDAFLAKNETYDTALPRLRVDSIRLRELVVVSPPDRRVETGEVYYVPWIYSAENVMPLPLNLDDAWHLRWASQVLALFAGRPETSFVWKALPIGNYAADPARQLLDQHGPPNVRYETKFFTEGARNADRVIIDYPGTPLFEAVAMGRPVLGLAFTRFIQLRPGVIDLFSPSLVPCRDEDQALAAIEEFLDDSGDAWLVPRERIMDLDRPS